MALAENDFFADKTNPLFAFDAATIQQIFSQAGFTVTSSVQTLSEKRRITPQDIAHWFTPETSAYGASLAASLTADGVKQVAELLKEASTKMLFDWKTENIFFTVYCNK